MSEIYNIPIKYKKGIYGMEDFEKSTENVIELNYEEFGEIVTYEVPDYKCNSQVTLYAIPKEQLEKTLRATYSDNGCLKKVTANVRNKDILLYIHYENMEAARQEIHDFAIKNADSIIEKICMCKETVSRLFIEYFNDGEAMDFHAKIGTEVQKNELEKKYPNSKNIADSCGDYPMEDIIDGDNDALKIMISCADRENMDFFQYAVDIMSERIAEKALEKLNKSEDFKFLSMEYD